MNILVLCTGNSARSILLESILNRRGAGRITAYSAGSHPTGRVHPQARHLLETLGHDVSGFRSKSWDEFARPGAPVMDVVITVCGSAAGETCPLWPGAPVQSHWGVSDPAAAPPDTQQAEFRHIFDRLDARADAFLALPVEHMTPEALKPALDRIGAL